MIGLFFAQVLMSFNVAALPVSLGGMADTFDVPVTTVSSTIVVYGLAVAALVMVGAKIGQRVGWLTIFRAVLVVFACSSLLMIFSRTVAWVIAGQALAGAAAAIIVPSLVALIAQNYDGEQKATAIGSLGSARAISGFSAFFIGGALGTWIGWQPVFVIVLAVAVLVFALSFTLTSEPGDPGVDIDVIAAVLIGVAVVLLTMGFNNLNVWGVFFADDAAPFSFGGVSPAPVMVVVGLVVGQCFFLWTRRRMATGRVPLVDLSILHSPRERAAVYAMFVIVAMEAAVNFTIPVYTQVVQGRTPFDTAIAMIPFNLTVFVTATLVVRVYSRFTPRQIGVFAFGLTTAALIWLAFVVNNNWESLPTIVGLIAFGIGQGALVTLVFNVLVTSAPTRLAGDVGSIRGATQNLASAIGTAVMGALLVQLLSFGVLSAVDEHPKLPESLVAQVDLDNVNFTTNDDLRTVLARTDATPAQVEAAVALNEDARLDTLRYGFWILAGISLLALVPARRLPDYRPDDARSDELDRDAVTED